VSLRSGLLGGHVRGAQATTTYQRLRGIPRRLSLAPIRRHRRPSSGGQDAPQAVQLARPAPGGIERHPRFRAGHECRCPGSLGRIQARRRAHQLLTIARNAASRASANRVRRSPKRFTVDTAVIRESHARNSSLRHVQASWGGGIWTDLGYHSRCQLGARPPFAPSCAEPFPHLIVRVRRDVSFRTTQGRR
jgi:hypothetical protein